jgi:hypothetical protein
MVKTIYSSIVQMVIHAESITWNRFYNFLLTNSILILAWATIYVSCSNSQMTRILLLAICILGMIGCVFWAALGARGRKFLDIYIDMGKDMENDMEKKTEEVSKNDPNTWPDLVAKHKLFKKTEETGRTACYGWASSKPILAGGPLLLIVLYILLLYASFIR